MFAMQHGFMAYEIRNIAKIDRASVGLTRSQESGYVGPFHEAIASFRAQDIFYRLCPQPLLIPLKLRLIRSESGAQFAAKLARQKCRFDLLT